jgi:hypothetical protein
LLIWIAKIISKITFSTLHDPTGRFFAKVDHQNPTEMSSDIWAKKVMRQDVDQLTTETMAAEFKAIAIVMDKFFLIAFFLATLISTGYIIGNQECHTHLRYT